MSFGLPETALRPGAPLVVLVLACLVGGCASAPAPDAVRAAPAPSFGPDSGMVIGTLSYKNAGAPRARKAWVVHLERVDRPSQADYVLAASVDNDSQSGVFTGTLPAGVYTFREADTPESQFAATGMRMPFEVQPGAVQDAGHYTLRAQ